MVDKINQKPNKIKTNKKSEGLTLTTIVTAILVLVVLVVLIMIFTGQINWGVKGLNDCESKGYTCVESSKECTDQGGSVQNIFTCNAQEKNLKTCCQIIKEKKE